MSDLHPEERLRLAREFHDELEHTELIAERVEDRLARHSDMPYPPCSAAQGGARPSAAARVSANHADAGPAVVRRAAGPILSKTFAPPAPSPASALGEAPRVPLLAGHDGQPRASLLPCSSPGVPSLFDPTRAPSGHPMVRPVITQIPHAGTGPHSPTTPAQAAAWLRCQPLKPKPERKL